jgi:hypothetical protein
MGKNNLIIIFVIIFLGLIFGTYQYFQVLETERVSAVTVGIPTSGHDWTQMECNADTLCMDTANKRLGVGTNNPTEKLEVGGNIKASGDICGGGSCLSVLGKFTNSCGAAATTYAYSATAYSGTYCAISTPTPTAPAWPVAGSSTTWTCPVPAGTPISCTATHSN